MRIASPARATIAPHRSDWRVGSASQSARSRTRTRAGRAAAQSSSAFSELSPSESVLHRRPSLPTPAACRGTSRPGGTRDRSGSRRPNTATPRCRPARHGPLRSGSVGPKIDTIGVPTAAAMCSGPVSPDTISDAAPADRDEVGEPGRRRQHARRRSTPRRPIAPATPRPAPRARTAPARAPRAGTPPARRTAPRPALVRPRRARVDQRERRAGRLPRRSRRAPPMARCRSGKLTDGSVMPSAAQQPQVLVDDVALAALARRDFDRLGIERPRALLAQVPDREAEDLRRARRARQDRRLHQPLEVERRRVLSVAQARASPGSSRAIVGRSTTMTRSTQVTRSTISR